MIKLSELFRSLSPVANDQDVVSVRLGDLKRLLSERDEARLIKETTFKELDKQAKKLSNDKQYIKELEDTITELKHSNNSLRKDANKAKRLQDEVNSLAILTRKLEDKIMSLELTQPITVDLYA